MAYLVRTMPRAEADLDAIFVFIHADTSSPAQRWFSGLIDAIESLSESPHRSPHAPENQRLRHQLYGNKPHIYRVIYSIDEAKRQVAVVHVRHHARTAFTPEDVS